MIKHLVRGVSLSLIGAFVIFAYAGDRTKGVSYIMNDAQVHSVQLIAKADLINNDVDKKLVKKTVSKKEVTPSAAAATSATSAAMNKGSFTATAYCLKGRTAMGHGVRRGIIAADPRVLKLGSRVNLGAGAYSGQYLVSDTGGAIKGRKIDIWVPNCAEARRFGRRKVMIGVSGR